MIIKRRLKIDHFAFQWLAGCIVLLIIGGIIGSNIYFEYNRTQRNEEERLLSVTRIVQENIEQNLIATKDVLWGLRKYSLWKKVDKDINTRLEILSNAIPGVRTIGIMNARGISIAASRPELIGRDFSQRDYFKIPREHPDINTLYVTPPFKSILGTFTLNVSIIITDLKGEFAGVITASLDPDYFAPVLSSVLYAKDMRSSIQQEDGVTFVIAPVVEGIVGSNLAKPGSMFLRHKKSGKDTTVFSGLIMASGDKRMIAQRNIKPAKLQMDKNLQVAVSRSMPEIFAGWRSYALIQGSLFALIVIASLLGLYLYQRSRRLFNQQAAVAAATLQESEEKFRSFVENANDIVYSLTPDGFFTYVSPNWTEALGHNVNEVTGISFETFVHPDDLPQCRDFLKKTIATGEKQSGVQYRVLHKNGTWRWHTSNASAIRNANGKIISFIGIARDITEHKEEEIAKENMIAQLQEALQNIKTLTGLLPICSSCKKIRDDKGYWNQLESYISEHSDALFSHGFCPECAAKYRHEMEGILLNKKQQ